MKESSNNTSLSTLQENLENVSLEVDPQPLRIIKRSSSQSFQSTAKGLGISTLPRRPSDNAMFKTIQSKNNNNNSKVSIMERPVSNDSIMSSNVSDFFSEDVNSRNSSLTSGSVGNSPTLHQHINTSTSSFTDKSHYKTMASSSQLSVHRLRDQSSSSSAAAASSSMTTPKFNTKFSIAGSSSQLSLVSENSINTSSSTVNTFTPSQRYRLRRQNSKSSSRATIKEKEKYFDDVNSDDESFADGLIWNVPFTKGTATMFSPTSGKPPSLIKSIMDESPALLPMSPLPGSAPSSPMIFNEAGGDGSSFFYLQKDEAHSISRFYEASSEEFAKRELRQRELSSSNLPSVVKQASSLGLDDMRLISKEKADSLSSTRPIWLPPKPQEESKKHERDISKMFENAAKLDKKRQEEEVTLKELREKNKMKWAELEDRGTVRNSTQYEMKKLCFKSAIPDHLRYRIWSQTMGMKCEKSQVQYEKYQELKDKLDTIPELPSSKMMDIEATVGSVLVSMQKFQKGQELHEKLCRLIKMKMISTHGVKVGDELMLAVLLLKFNEVDSYNLLNLMRSTVFDDVIMSKFNNNLTKNAVLKKYLGDREFKDDMSQLNSNMVYTLFMHLEDTCIIYQLLDIAVLNDGYRIWYSIFLVMLREFHFGFNDLGTLMKSDDYICINDTNKLFERVYHFFKKF